MPDGDDGNASRGREPRASRGRWEPGAEPPRTSSPSPCPNRARRVRARSRRRRDPPVIAGGRRSAAGERPRPARAAASGVVPRGPRLVPAPRDEAFRMCRRADDDARSSRSTRRCSFPELEQRILAFWKEADVFARSLDAARAARPRGSSTRARPRRTASPGVHHVEPRTFKDVYPRFKTMTGHLRPAQGRLGLPRPAGRARGREGDRHHRQAGHRGVRHRRVQPPLPRVGAALRRTSASGSPSASASGSTLDDAYWTMDTEYIECVWWSLKQLHERGLLVEADKVTAYCPRCGTALSDAEVALGYADGRGPERLRPVPDRRGRPTPRSSAPRSSCGPRRRGRSRRTRAPPSTPSADYVVVERDGERLVVARRARASACSATDGEVVRDADRARRSSAPATSRRTRTSRARTRWSPADFVSMDDGTGIVHMAPAFGARGPRGRPRAGLAGVQAGRTTTGRFTDQAPAFVRGLFVKDADPRDRRGPARARPAARAQETLRAQLPVLLALRDAAPLLRAHLLVRPHDRR